MFQELSITACDNVTVRDLLRLKKEGHCVYRSSHAGNWNLYKLLMSELGLPDCIWDVTCIYRDVNNQPRHQLIRGEKIHLLGANDPGEPYASVKYLTPYYRTESDEKQTLSNFHVRPLKKLFGNVITSQSEVLLQQKRNLEMVFDVVQRYKPEWLGRYAFPCGCMVKISGSKASCKHNHAEIRPNKLAESAIQTLEELRQLVFNSVGYEAKGGVVYSFELVVASFYLWAYWQFGDKTIYELSGPDMIGYATKPDFIRKIEQVLRLVGEYAPDLVPGKIEAKIVPATFFRFGYPKNCKVSKTVMAAHDTIVKIQEIKRKHKHSPEILRSMDAALGGVLPIIGRDGKSWNLFHEPSRDAFYSQHDMLANSNRMEVMEGFLDVSFQRMGEILRTLPQIEAGLVRNLFHQSKMQRKTSPFGPVENSIV